MGMFDSRYDNRDVEKTITNRYRIFIAVVAVLFLVLSVKQYTIQVTNGPIYSEQLEKSNSEVTTTPQPPRGVIYDRNYNIIVGNKPVYTIKYDKPSYMGVYDSRELEYAYKIAELIDMPTNKLQSRDIKDFYIREYNKEALSKLTSEERSSLMSVDEKYALIRSRLTDEDLSVFTDTDYEAIALFTEMNRGFRSQTKIIKNVDVTENEYSIMSEKETDFPGIITSIDWVRYYPYGNLMRGILGKVSSTSQGVPSEYKDEYQALGYDLDTRVGSVNSLEAEFEMFLNSVEGQTLSNDSGLYEVITEAKGGNDLVFTIDMELTQRLSDAIDDILLDASQYPNSKYMDKAYVMITNPQTGEIISMVARRMKENDQGEKYFEDFSYALTTSLGSVLAGSTVKPAFLAAAMDAGVISPGDRKLDECIKIAATPQKCSWRSGLGVLNDIQALYQSSNSYMFKTVLEWAGGTYIEDKAIRIDPNTFSELRKYYNEFGLGMETDIDIPNEEIAYMDLNGSLPGFLMDLSIGQYDQYTVAQLSQYITTLANGEFKMKPRLLKEVYTPSNTEPLKDQLYSFTPIADSAINIDQKYIDRVRYGMRYSADPNSQLVGKLIDYIPEPAVKTGTSEGFYYVDEGNGQGYLITDHVFISEAFMAFAPYSNPDMAMIIVIPNVRYLDGDEYKYPAREKITKEVTRIYYEMY